MKKYGMLENEALKIFLYYMREMEKNFFVIFSLYDIL